MILAEDSPVEETFCPPAALRTSLARLISSAVSQCTESRISPFCRRPSYLLASNSGIPMPIKAPVTPPTAPPTPNPARPAMMGPAAMNGPRPGIAKSPTPARRPNVPPITPPAVTPTVVPSGAFVSFSVPMFFVPPRLSGKSTEMSEVGKPARTSESIALSTAIRVEKIPNTPTFLLDISLFSFEFKLISISAQSFRRCDVELVGYVFLSCYADSFGFQITFLLFRPHWPTKCHFAILRNDLDVVRVGGETLILVDRFSNLLCDGPVGGIHLLLIRSRARLIFVCLGVVWGRLLVILRRGWDGH